MKIQNCGTMLRSRWKTKTKPKNNMQVIYSRVTDLQKQRQGWYSETHQHKEKMRIAQERENKELQQIMDQA